MMYKRVEWRGGGEGREGGGERNGGREGRGRKDGWWREEIQNKALQYERHHMPTKIYWVLSMTHTSLGSMGQAIHPQTPLQLLPTLNILSGVLFATSSMSTPPAGLPTNTGP